ncbi:MAG: HAD-IIA family hydrolase [Promethearchaeota archaeon]
MTIKESFQKIKGLLIDIDGTLYYKGKVIPKSVEIVSNLRKAGLKLLFLTNTDSKSPATILKILKAYGFQVDKDEIFTPIIALKEFLSKYSDKNYYFVTTAEVNKEFQEFQHVEGSEIPDFVIISDFHDNWDVNRLNLAFRYVLKGAKLLGTQGNKYYLDYNGEPVIDTGSFIQMIATAANVVPRIFGKPSKEYFLQALEKLKLTPDDVFAIGDDLESDIQGAINADIKGILVKTGKGENFDSTTTIIKPFLVLDSFSSIIKLF